MVDDLRMNVEILPEMVTLMGYTGRTATSAGDAFEHIRQKLP